MFLNVYKPVTIALKSNSKKEATAPGKQQQLCSQTVWSQSTTQGETEGRKTTKTNFVSFCFAADSCHTFELMRWYEIAMTVLLTPKDRTQIEQCLYYLLQGFYFGKGERMKRLRMGWGSPLNSPHYRPRIRVWRYFGKKNSEDRSCFPKLIRFWIKTFIRW